MNKKILLVLCMIFGLSFLVVSGVASAASCEGVDTAIISCGDNESGIGHILKLVLDNDLFAWMWSGE